MKNHWWPIANIQLGPPLLFIIKNAMPVERSTPILTTPHLRWLKWHITPPKLAIWWWWLGLHALDVASKSSQSANMSDNRGYPSAKIAKRISNTLASSSVSQRRSNLFHLAIARSKHKKKANPAWSTINHRKRIFIRSTSSNKLKKIGCTIAKICPRTVCSWYTTAVSQSLRQSATNASKTLWTSSWSIHQFLSKTSRILPF